MGRFKMVGLVVAGFVVALLAVPSGALSAATQLVSVTSADGLRTATVTPGKQILATDQAPSSAFAMLLYTDSIRPCPDPAQYTVPKTKSLILKTATFIMEPSTSSVSPAEDDISIGPPGGGCDDVVATAVTAPTAGWQTVNEDFASEVGVPAGWSVYVSRSNQANGYIHLYGYFEPASAVPASSVTANPHAKR